MNHNAVNLYNSKSRNLKYLLYQVKSLIEGIEIKQSKENFDELNYDFVQNDENLNEMIFLNKLQSSIKSKQNGENVSFNI